MLMRQASKLERYCLNVSGKCYRHLISLCTRVTLLFYLNFCYSTLFCKRFCALAHLFYLEIMWFVNNCFWFVACLLGVLLPPTFVILLLVSRQISLCCLPCLVEGGYFLVPFCRPLAMLTLWFLHSRFCSVSTSCFCKTLIKSSQAN